MDFPVPGETLCFDSNALSSAPTIRFFLSLQCSANFSSTKNAELQVRQIRDSTIASDGVILNEMVDLSRVCTSWYNKHNQTGMFKQPLLLMKQDLNYQIETHLVSSWISDMIFSSLV